MKLPWCIFPRRVLPGFCTARAFSKHTASILSSFEKLKNVHNTRFAERILTESRVIRITLPDGRQVKGEALKTTPYEIALQISKGLAESAVTARVNGILFDLDRPLEGDSTLELLKFDSEEGQAVFWYSSAYVLGAALNQAYGGLLCQGLSTKSGFFYDMYMANGTVSGKDLPWLEDLCKSIIKEKLPFERIEVARSDLLELFKHNEFKMRIIHEKVKTPSATVYRCGTSIDLCHGPHVRHTGKIKALKLLKNSSSYWNGDPSHEQLQRIYGISFPDVGQLREWERVQEEASSQDHRTIGKAQELFFFHDMSPGSCFFLPRGTQIYTTLMDFIKSEYRKRGFMEVISPNLYNVKLWETSGHWEHYKNNMFSFHLDGETFALKPMNCPGHCLMFDHRPRSWRELPVRLADFGVLHRNELSGTLSGLTRVRRFQQDDAHIFCAMEQLDVEIAGCLDFLQTVYSVFGFTFTFCLSTRPDQFLGDAELWDQAEKQLQKSLNDFGQPWELNPGDGAFYGPKIDIQIRDALGRHQQCATIQLDFQLPIRFDLRYTSKDGNAYERPVMIHRAVLGSVERMVAILAENYAGKWPLWLSPFQVMVISVAPSTEAYAKEVLQRVHEAGFMVDIDADLGTTLNRKIRKAQLAQYNFLLVVGEKERKNSTVNVRTRDNKQHGEWTLEEVLARLSELQASRARDAEQQF
ncbi:threonine--tRNA ligase, mitochondrial [Microcaecilia unicolor]|uniref:threonine--tRNA ligase n=1 Tax=Microcaecilia unicolor TaxID=1415580 RepID=A0A6P7WYQ2_9AMPH|nr:threonine--tRNA ligase, mitochondrial [Microcaecilia unicolor]